MSAIDLNDLKRLLIALVASNDSSCSLKKLQETYKKRTGRLLPIYQYGFRHAALFLKAKFSDCFTIKGDSSNPVVTLIKPNNEEQKGLNQKLRKNVFHAFLKRRIPDFVPKAPPVPAPLSADDKTESDQQLTGLRRRIKKKRFFQLKREIHQLVKDSGDGIHYLRVMSCYKERYKRELNYSQFGYCSIKGILTDMGDVVTLSPAADQGWIVRDCSTIPEEGEEDTPTTSASEPTLEPVAAPVAGVLPPIPVDDPAICRVCRDAWPLQVTPTTYVRPSRPEEALPGIAYDPDEFPTDCMQLEEVIPPVSIVNLRRGVLVAVVIGEVYSLSHFWFYLDENNVVLNNMTEQMTVYYVSDVGKERPLSRSAVRKGHYCAAMYFGDWYRAVIVRIIDDDYVKVRFVDYGNVEKMAVSALRPLLRVWGALPAQATRARLAGVRPAAGAHRWPHTACLNFAKFVKDYQFYATVSAVNVDEQTVELFLLDISTEEDVCVTRTMISAGDAVSKDESSLSAEYCYTRPSFAALESGSVPHLAEIDVQLLAFDDCLYWLEGVETIAERDLPPSDFPQQVDLLSSLHKAENAVSTIDLDADTFPADCLQLGEELPRASIADLNPDDLFEVKVGEVNSPSHFWVYRLGDQYHIELEIITDRIAAYYKSVGKERYLARGAVFEGHYCVVEDCGHWYRAVIVRIVDYDHVKVRLVDYGRVEKVAVSALRPLLRAWAALPAQATRARLAGVRPSDGAVRWPTAASTQFLTFVRGLRFVASVTAIRKDTMTLELYLIDTSHDEIDECVVTKMICIGSAVQRADTALWAKDFYLGPSFEAQESGTAPSLKEVSHFLANNSVGEDIEWCRRNRCAFCNSTQLDDEAPQPAIQTVEEVEVAPVAEHRDRSSAAAKKTHRRNRRAALKNKNKPFPPPPPPLW